LTSALSATIGLGNIAGVAIAIQLGGPGAVFWMMIAAFFGMSEKFSSCTLSQLYRRRNADGSISGGPMYYLDLGLREKGGAWRTIGKVLAVMFAFMVMGGSLGGGNMFQSNQSFEAVSDAFGVPQSANWLFGLIMAFLVGLVIIGGIKRIGAATSRIVPAMVLIYVIASIVVIVTNITRVPAAISLIFRMAFSENAAYGGIVGVLVWGIKRASFSNEAGLGSSAIAHAAAKTEEPVREGLVGMMEPFVDTIIVCLMTGVVVVVSGVWNDPEVAKQAAGSLTGVKLTAAAFATVISWFPYILSLCVLLFAYSTMISWCYYGERGWIYLLDHFGGRGLRTVVVFRIVFVCFVFVGAVTNLSEVLGFSDLLILCMAFPNIVGSVILAPHVRRIVEDYWRRFRSGTLKPYSDSQARAV
jgi:AGCS family alanine or glycine:cation symporter